MEDSHGVRFSLASSSVVGDNDDDSWWLEFKLPVLNIIVAVEGIRRECKGGSWTSLHAIQGN